MFPLGNNVALSKKCVKTGQYFLILDIKMPELPVDVTEYEYISDHLSDVFNVLFPNMRTYYVSTKLLNQFD